MQKHDSGFSSAERLEIAYTDKPVSGWGGLVAVVRFFEKIGVREALLCALPDGRTSPNQIPVVDIVLAFLMSVLTGGRRFAHIERLRGDEVAGTTVGITRWPSAMTVTRYLGGFVRAQVEHLGEVCWQLVRSRLQLPSLGSVLDFDSSVLERYGQQEGSLKGYNPRRKGRPSHHPIFAMLAEAKLVVHCWLRSGNTGTARGVNAFLAETLERLKGIALYALRADSGFFIKEFLDELERRELPYAIAVRMSPLVKQAIVGIKQWTRVGPGLDAAEMWFQLPSWRAARRFVVIREELRERPEAAGRRLLAIPGYTFHAVVTTLTLSPVDTWHFYNSRGDCENRLKELKEDFGADGYCLDSFDGTEAALRLVCFLYNLMALFKREVLQDDKPRLSTVRTAVLVVGAILGREGRTPVLRLGLRERWRDRFSALLERIASIKPTVAQLVSSVENMEVRPWKARVRRSYPRGVSAAA
jgi:Transposase DDE domain group 1